ncbi:MAG: tetraacyldisaccharide 4'-kinase [Acetobacter sp.]|nr:tetraacyldisaccharide 4'-kinase [Acetobacter sp.]
MRGPPKFWQEPDRRFLPFLLAPFSKIVAACAARRLRQSGWKAPVPVLCCGNLTMGGTGKTTVVLDLMARLQAQGVVVHALIRGYKGRITTPTQVDPIRHTARDVGDEALLLAACGPTWVGGNRAVSAQKAIQAGAQCLIMDDGLQNPTLHKTYSVLIIDGAVGLGNGHVLPAGPLREEATGALQRADVVLMIGHDKTGFLTRYAPFLRHTHVMHANLQTVMPLAPEKERQPYVAFAGLGRPDKFFEGLKQAQAHIVKTCAFPDHYFYQNGDIQKLYALAQHYNARLLTTPKDAIRLPAAIRNTITLASVSLQWGNAHMPEHILNSTLHGKRA